MGVDITSFVGDIPAHYDRGLGPVIFEDFGEQMAQRAAAYAPARVLELAAGTGIVSRRLRDRLAPASTLTITDLNPPMLEVARRKFDATEQIAFQAADACELPFPNAAFDLVVCQFGVMFFPDKAKGFAEAFRVLSPGGRYLFSVWDSQAHNRFGALAQATLTSMFEADPPRFYDVPFGYHSLDLARQQVESAGFEAFTAQVSHIDKQVPDIVAFADGLMFGNPLAEQLRARGVDDTQKVHAAMVSTLRKALGDPARLSLQALFFEATRP